MTIDVGSLSRRDLVDLVKRLQAEAREAEARAVKAVEAAGELYESARRLRAEDLKAGD